jgi:thymidylate synthase
MYLLKTYDKSLDQIINNGTYRTNKRTKIRTRSIFGLINKYRLDTDYFPIVTRRKVYPKSVFAELLWFLSGSTNNKDLQSLGCNFWSPWVDSDFETKNGFAEDLFGPVYGFQLRHFGGEYGNGIGGKSFTNQDNVLGQNCYGKDGFDQLKWVIDRIKSDHSCRRTLWTLWNPKDLERSRLPPCHMMYQVLVDDDRRLTGIMYQRSCDFPIGVPANIQFYSALTVMIAQQTDCLPYEFVHFTGDSHVYDDQIEGVKKYLELPIINSPKLKINKAKDIFSYKPEDFEIIDFESGPKIEIPVAV